MNIPTDNQVLRAAEVICAANGVEPDDFHIEEAAWNPLTGEMSHSFQETWLEHFKPGARSILAVLMNQDYVEGGTR